MNKYFIIIVLIISCILIGCITKDTDGINSDNKTAKVKFTRNKINIGKFKSGSSRDIEFYVKNISETPLVIDTMQASCACTVGKFPRNPILKNDSGLIVVTFKPKLGVYGYFEKSIVISANTKPSFSVLTIEGEIVE